MFCGDFFFCGAGLFQDTVYDKMIEMIPNRMVEFFLVRPIGHKPFWGKFTFLVILKK